VKVRSPTLIAVALWIVSIGLIVVGVALGPEGQCDSDNHDSYVVEARRAGIALLAAAFALAAAGSFLAAGALGKRPRRSKLWRGIASFSSFALAGITALIGLLSLIAFSCLE
jgi:hypothetical protein